MTVIIKIGKYTVTTARHFSVRTAPGSSSSSSAVSHLTNDPATMTSVSETARGGGGGGGGAHVANTDRDRVSRLPERGGVAAACSPVTTRGSRLAPVWLPLGSREAPPGSCDSQAAPMASSQLLVTHDPLREKPA